MKLSEWLGSLPPGSRNERLASMGLDGLDPAGAAERLSSGEHLSGLLRRWRPWVRQVLQMAAARFGLQAFESQQLEREALEEGISGAHVKAALAILRRQTVLLSVRKAFGEEWLLLPEETFPVWGRLLFPGGLIPVGQEEAELELAGESGCAAYELLTFLHTLAMEPVVPTKQGAWPKAVRKKLAGQLGLRDDAVLPLFPNADNPCSGYWEPALAVIADLTIRSGLVTVRERAWTTDTTALPRWLGQSLPQIQRELYTRFREVWTGSEVWETHVLARLESAEPGRWYMLAHLFEWLRDCGMIKRIADTVLSDFVHTRLLPMQALGFVQVAVRPGTSDYAFRLLFPLGDGAGTRVPAYGGMLVQPDLELILPPYPPLHLVWDCHTWCEMVSRGEMFVFRMTRSSVEGAFTSGCDPDEWISTLERWSAGPLDALVTDVIREWTLTRDRSGRPQWEEPASNPEVGRPAPLLEPVRQEPACMPSLDSPDPVWNGVPSAWLNRMDRYHPSTRKDIMLQAIRWKTPVRLGGNGEEKELIPIGLYEEGRDWLVEGLVGRSRVTVRPEEWSLIQIVVPESGE